MGNYCQNSNYYLKEYDKAIIHYNRAIDINPNNENSWHGLGNVYHKLKEYDKAIRHYNKAIQIDPNYEHSWSGLGNVYNDIKEYKKAIKHYNRAIDINPDYEAPWNGLGNVYYSLKEYEKAIKHYNRAIEINPNHEAPENGLGHVYYSLKEYEKAIKHYNRAIEINPNYEAPENGLGSVYYSLKEYEKAIKYYNNAIEINEHLAAAWYNLGNTYKVIGNFGEAQRHYLKSIFLNNLQPQSFYFLAKNNNHPFLCLRLLQQLGIQETENNTFVKAKAEYEKLVEQCLPLSTFLNFKQTKKPISATNNEWQINLAMLNYYTGDPIMAIEILKKQLPSNDLRVYFYLIKAYQAICENEDDFIADALSVINALDLKNAISDAEILEVYYAAYIQFIDTEEAVALFYFDTIADRFLPAAYMCLHLSVGEAKERYYQLILQQEKNNPKQSFANGLPIHYLNLEKDSLETTFTPYFRYFEIDGAINEFKFLAESRKEREVVGTKGLVPFHQFFVLEEEKQAKSVYAFYDTYFEQWKQRLIEQGKNIKPNEAKSKVLDDDKGLNIIKLTDERAALEEHNGFEKALSKLIKNDDCSQKLLLDLINYYAALSKISPQEKLQLQTYTLLYKSNKPYMEGHLGEGIGDVVRTLVSSGIGHLTGILSGSSVAFASIPIIGAATPAFLTGVLAYSIIQYIKKHPAIRDYQSFKDGFKAFMVLEKERLGAQFESKYGLEIEMIA